MKSCTCPSKSFGITLKEVAAFIPGACVKTFPLAGGDVKELIVASEKSGPVDWPSLAPLVRRKEEWLAAIDRVVRESARCWMSTIGQGSHLRPLPPR